MECILERECLLAGKIFSEGGKFPPERSKNSQTAIKLKMESRKESEIKPGTGATITNLP